MIKPLKSTHDKRRLSEFWDKLGLFGSVLLRKGVAVGKTAGQEFDESER
jgi:hypothetical protein